MSFFVHLQLLLHPKIRSSHINVRIELGVYHKPKLELHKVTVYRYIRIAFAVQVDCYFTIIASLRSSIYYPCFNRLSIAFLAGH